jgi:hypothetical protein
MDVELERNTSYPISSYYPNIRLEGQTKPLKWYSRYLSRNSKRIPLEYKSETLQLEPAFSAYIDMDSNLFQVMFTVIFTSSTLRKF